MYRHFLEHRAGIFDEMVLDYSTNGDKHGAFQGIVLAK